MTDGIEGRAAPRIAKGWIPEGEDRPLILYDTDEMPYIREDALPDMPPGIRARMEREVVRVNLDRDPAWFWSLIGIARIPGAAELEWERDFVGEFMDDVVQELRDSGSGPIPGAEENPA